MEIINQSNTWPAAGTHKDPEAGTGQARTPRLLPIHPAAILGQNRRMGEKSALMSICPVSLSKLKSNELLLIVKCPSPLLALYNRERAHEED